MATYTTTPVVGGVLPEQWASDRLIVEPVSRASVALDRAVSTSMSTANGTVHIPVIRDDAGASWVNEGDEIAPDDTEFDEIEVVPHKVAGLSVVSRELANDSSPAAAQMIGDSLARSIAKQIDSAFFSDPVLAAPAPAGLGSVTDATVVDAGAAWSSLDPFTEATSEAEQLGVTITSWVANPADALALAQLKDETTTGSLRPLLAVDPTQPSRRTIEGVPLLVSPAVVAGTIWGMPSSRVIVVRREDVTVETSGDVFFTSDRIAIRAVMRVGFGFPSHTSVVKVQTTTV